MADLRGRQHCRPQEKPAGVTTGGLEIRRAYTTGTIVWGRAPIGGIGYRRI
jgi:hypothetical protein